MNIQTFTPERLEEHFKKRPEQIEKYYSTILHQHFPIIKQRVPYVLEPIAKDEIKTALPRFANQLTNPHGNFTPNPDFFSDEKQHYCIRYETNIEINKKPTTIQVRCRTHAEDQLVNNMLKAFHESTILRYCCDTTQLEQTVQETYKQQKRQTWENCKWLISNPRGQLKYVFDKDMREQYLQTEIDVIFDALYMLTPHYSPQTVLNTLAEYHALCPEFPKDSKTMKETKRVFRTV